MGWVFDQRTRYELQAIPHAMYTVTSWAMSRSFTRLSSAGLGSTICTQSPETERRSKDAVYSLAPPAKFFNAPPNRKLPFGAAATDRNSQFEHPPHATEMRSHEVPWFR